MTNSFTTTGLPARISSWRFAARRLRPWQRPPANGTVPGCLTYPRVDWRLPADHGGLSAEEESAILDESLATVRLVSGQPVIGWLSPGLSQSPRTLDLLAERGVEFVCDWVNDDLPYPLNATPRGLYAMPYPHELSDATIVWQDRHSPAEFVEQVRDQFDWLYREAERCGGRIFGLAVHPWIIGQPHRIRSLAEALTYILGHERIWPATASEILAAFRSQQGEGK